MPGLMSKMGEDLTITRKLPNGTTMTVKSPQGSRLDMDGIMGGMIEGSSPTPVADNIPIQATAGEYVVNVPAAQKYKGLLEQINNEGRQMLAQGGWTKPKTGLMGYANGGNISYGPPRRGRAAPFDPEFGGPYVSDARLERYPYASDHYVNPNPQISPERMNQRELITQPDDPLAAATVYWVDRLGIPGTDHGFFTVEDTIKEWNRLTPDQQRQVGSLEQFIRYSAYEQGLLPDHGPQNFWTGGEVGVGEPEEGDTLEGIKGGQGITFRDGKWVYGKSGKDVQPWLLERINSTIQPIVVEGEANLPVTAPLSTTTPMQQPCPDKGMAQGYWTGGEVGVGDPEEGDSPPSVKGGQGIVYRNGQWVYARSGKPAQEWVIKRINEAIQPIVTEGEKELDVQTNIGDNNSIDPVATGDTTPSVSTVDPIVEHRDDIEEVADTQYDFKREGQGQNYYFAIRALEAEEVLRELEAKGYNPASFGKKKSDIAAFLAGDLARTEDDQRYTRAVRTLTEVSLRKDTGAAAPEPEVVRKAVELFPSLGTGKGASKDLYDQRQAIIKGVIDGAGVATGDLTKVYNELPDTREVEQDPIWTAEDTFGTIGGISGGAIGSLLGPFGTAGGAAAGTLLGREVGEWWRGDQDSWVPDQRDLADAAVSGVGGLIAKPVAAGAKILAKPGAAKKAATGVGSLFGRGKEVSKLIDDFADEAAEVAAKTAGGSSTKFGALKDHLTRKVRGTSRRKHLTKQEQDIVDKKASEIWEQRLRGRFEERDFAQGGSVFRYGG